MRRHESTATPIYVSLCSVYVLKYADQRIRVYCLYIFPKNVISNNNNLFVFTYIERHFTRQSECVGLIKKFVSILKLTYITRISVLQLHLQLHVFRGGSDGKITVVGKFRKRTRTRTYYWNKIIAR